MVNEESLTLMTAARRSPYQMTPKNEFTSTASNSSNHSNANGSPINVSSTGPGAGALSLAPITLTKDELNELKNIDR